MPSSWPLLVQKSLLALCLAAALVLLCILARRRLSAYEEQSRAHKTLLYEMLANVSEGLDRLEAGLDDIATRAATAKSRLRQFAAARKQSLLACALLKQRREQPTTKVPGQRRRERKGALAFGAVAKKIDGIT